MKQLKRKLVAGVLTLALSASMVQPGLAAMGKVTKNFLVNEDLAPGIHYSEEDIHNYGADGNRRVRMNHLTVDPQEQDVRFKTTRAEGVTINARENILNQALREVYQGEHVVAAINADAYDMDRGINCGIQVRDGEVIISQPSNQYTKDTPVFFIDGKQKAHIAPLRSVADITISKDDGEYRKSIITINRNVSTSDNLRLFTHNITSNHVMTHMGSVSSSTNQSYALIELENFAGGIGVGQEYTGTVKSIESKEGFNIPENCLVLAGYNNQAEEISKLKPGNKVSFVCHLYTGEFKESGGVFEERGELADDVRNAINGFHLLAKDGKFNEAQENTDINARTVIGLTKDGKIEILCVNKPGANFGSELTSGTTFREIANYMIQELGCVDVLNMDGGGSTEMVARRAGSDSLATVSYPSDGGSRLVSNSLLILSDAPRTAQVSQVLVDRDSKLYIGSETDFSVRLTDNSGSVISNEGHKIAWSAEHGTIDEKGHYVAPKEACEDTVTATVDGKKGTAQVNIVNEDGIASIGLNASGTVALLKGAVHPFGFKAYDEQEQEISIHPSVAEWSMTGDNIGTLDKNGVLHVTAESGNAIVKASFLGKEYSATVVVGLKEQIIDDFEGNQAAYHMKSQFIYPNHPEYFAGDGSNMIGITKDASQVKNGEGSLAWVYDTKDWTRKTNGTLNIFADWDALAEDRGWTAKEQAALMDKYRAKAQPKKFGLWIYSGDENHDGKSDNYNCMMVANFKANDGTWVDEKGETHYDGADGGKPVAKTIKITPDEHMDWIGWKYFEFDVPEDWPMPITFNYIMMSNIYKGSDQANYKTTIMMDDLKWIYTDEEQDLTGPEFSNIIPEGSGLFTDTLDFSTVITDESGIKKETITVTVNEEAVQDYTFDESTGKLSFTRKGLKNGEKYHVVVKAKDNKGNDSTSFVDKTYSVDLTEDKESPTIRNVTPISSSKLPLQIPSPRIGFRVSDLKSGVQAESIRVTLNGKEISDIYCDEKTGWSYAQPDFQLPEGCTSATITIDVSDKNGNAMETYRDTLPVALIAQPKDASNYSISVIPDTQGNAYSSLIFPKAAKSDSELVIHLGDIVDGVNTNEFNEGKKWADSMKKPYLVTAGNHEGGNLNLDMYQQYFGSPTYFFDYGSTRIIMLNSAFTQSITATDPTQYRFLKNALESNTLPNVYVISHVVPEDHFNTQHNMTAEECKQFQDILGAYKKEHPEVHVSQISGHLHTLETYERQGVQYIIGGNAAGKGYVSAEEGNLLGIGTIAVKDGQAVYQFDPLLTKVYLQNAAVLNGTMKLAVGASAQLDLYGDFREKPSIDSYMTQINDDPSINIRWESSEPSIAEVDAHGLVTLKETGTAKITATCGGKSSSIQIESTDISNMAIRKLSVSLPDTIYQNDTVHPTVIATDAYGATIVLNARDVSFKTKNETLKQNEDHSFVAEKAGDDVLTVSFGGKTAECAFTVRPPRSSGTGGGGAPSGNLRDILITKSPHGMISTSIKRAAKGTAVNLTVAPDRGYELQSIEVIGKDGKAVSLTEKGNGQFTFTMPGNDVTVRAVFVEKEAETPSYQDVPMNHWAAEAIRWAEEKGYMMGTGLHTFTPDGYTTRQQLWMIMARLQGENPANMAEARDWAMKNHISDGNNPENPVTREQMVTILYRYAEMKGYSVAEKTDLTSFIDYKTIAPYALDAMTWSVAHKIIGGTSANTLTPSGNATRAQFAMILMRFYQSFVA